MHSSSPACCIVEWILLIFGKGFKISTKADILMERKSSSSPYYKNPYTIMELELEVSLANVYFYHY